MHPPAGPRGRTGAAAEEAAARWLAGRGWTILARNVRVGRDELDLLAREPDGPTVAVEVRARSGPTFGSGVESVDAPKVARLYRAVAHLRRVGHPTLGPGPLAAQLRVDLLSLRLDRDGTWRVEAHLRGLEPPG